jgi:hypothetical protein
MPKLPSGPTAVCRQTGMRPGALVLKHTSTGARPHLGIWPATKPLMGPSCVIQKKQFGGMSSVLYKLAFAYEATTHAMHAH